MQAVNRSFSISLTLCYWFKVVHNLNTITVQVQ
jgi:hypothetical protein